MENKVYSAWANSDRVSNEDKESIKKISSNDINKYFTDNVIRLGDIAIKCLFQIGSNCLNKYTCKNIFHAYAKYIVNETTSYGQAKVIIGHDGRKNSDQIVNWAIDILSSYNIAILLFNKNNPVPAPMVAYFTKEEKCNGGMYISANYYPEQYSGIKFFNNQGGQICSEESQIEQYMKDNIDLLNNEDCTRVNSIVSYLDKKIYKKYLSVNSQIQIDSQSLYNANKFYSIVVTANQSYTNKLFKQYLKMQGFKHVYITEPHAKIDYVNCNPENPQCYTNAYKLADKKHSDICFAFDPDGSRFSASILSYGERTILNSHQIAILFAYYILNKKTEFSFNHPTIACSNFSTSLIEDIASKFDATVYRYPSPFKYICEQIPEIRKNSSLLFAFDESMGYVVSNTHNYRDGFAAALLLLEVYSWSRENNIPLINLLENTIYPKFGFNYCDNISLYLEDENKINEKYSAIQKYNKNEIANMQILKNFYNPDDGSIDYILENNSWIKFRRLFVDGKIDIVFSVIGVSLNDAKNRYLALKNEIERLLGITKNNE